MREYPKMRRNLFYFSCQVSLNKRTWHATEYVDDLDDLMSDMIFLQGFIDLVSSLVYLRTYGVEVKSFFLQGFIDLVSSRLLSISERMLLRSILTCLCASLSSL